MSFWIAIATRSWLRDIRWWKMVVLWRVFFVDKFHFLKDGSQVDSTYDLYIYTHLFVCVCVSYIWCLPFLYTPFFSVWTVADAAIKLKNQRHSQVFAGCLVQMCLVFNSLHIAQIKSDRNVARNFDAPDSTWFCQNLDPPKKSSQMPMKIDFRTSRLR